MDEGALPQDAELGQELEFLQAARDYRAARASGDSEAIKDAEDAWRERVRREIMENMK